MLKKIQQHLFVHLCFCVCVPLCSQVWMQTHKCSTYLEGDIKFQPLISTLFAYYRLSLLLAHKITSILLLPTPIFLWNQNYRFSQFEAGLYMTSGIQTQVLRFGANCFSPVSHHYSPRWTSKTDIWKNCRILFFIHHLISLLWDFKRFYFTNKSKVDILNI